MGKVGDKVRQILKEERDKEMTFPEMAQKLIDGEFEIGTELVCNHESYWVNKLSGYGLKPSKGAFVTQIHVGSIEMNSTWKVKEQPTKEMSIEELQKELGYKIKIVEHQSK